MTIIIESGQAAGDSVAYCSAAQADAYHLARGVAAWAALTTEQKESALVRGADFLQQTYRQRWAGHRVSGTQALDFPRYNVPRDYGGYYPSDSIPVELRNANAEAALRAAAGELIVDEKSQVKQKTVGPVSITYSDNARQNKKYVLIEKMLLPLLSGCSNSLRVIRV